MSIRDDVADLRRYLIELRVLLFDQASGEGGRGGKVIDSPAPWNTPVGELLTDIHAGARRLARQWAELLDRPLPAMGAIDAGTMRALDFVGTCVDRMRLVYPEVTTVEERAAIATAEAEVHGWAVRGRDLLGIARAGETGWTKAPGGLRCPNAGCAEQLFLPPGWTGTPAPSIYCRAEGVAWSYEEWVSLVA